MNTGNVPVVVGSCPLMLKRVLQVVALLPWPVYVAVNAVVVTAWLTSPGSPVSLVSGAGSISLVQAAVTSVSESRQRSVVVMARSPVAEAVAGDLRLAPGAARSASHRARVLRRYGSSMDQCAGGRCAGRSHTHG